MSSFLSQFESLVRSLPASTREILQPIDDKLHPFDERNIHPELAKVTRQLFDNGHYSQATFEAYKSLDKKVAKISGLHESGYKLMMTAFSDQNAKIKLTNLSSSSEVDEQKGYQFLFAGSVTAIRNPRGHEVNLPDSIDLCLDHLSLASALMRRLENRVSPR